MISEQAFAFPFKDKIWLNKFLIGTALVLAGFFIPIIPTLFVWGYLVRLMRDIIDTGEATMPEWDRWEDLGLKGIYYLLISFIYVLPGLVLVVGTIALFALSRLVGGEPLVPDSIASVAYASSMASRILLLASVLCLPVSLLVLFAGYVLTPVAIARFAATGILKAALELDRVWEVVRTQAGNFILAWVVSWAIGWGISIMVGTLYSTVCLCCLIPFVSAPLYLYQWLFRMSLFAQVYRKVAGSPPPTAPLLGPGPGEPEAAPLSPEVAVAESVPAQEPPAAELQPPASQMGEETTGELAPEEPSDGEVTEEPVASEPSGEETMGEPAPLGAAISEAAEPTDIGGLGLPPRTEKMLVDAGYSTVPQILEVLRTDESSLLQIKGFGEKSLETLKAALAEKGIEI